MTRLRTKTRRVKDGRAAPPLVYTECDTDSCVIKKARAVTVHADSTFHWSTTTRRGRAFGFTARATASVQRAGTMNCDISRSA